MDRERGGASRDSRRRLAVTLLRFLDSLPPGLLYAAIAGLAALESVFPPVPADTAAAFGAFLALLGRIGADRAGYVTVAIPIVALLFSATFEGLRWRMSLMLGILLCVAGNVSVLWGRGASRR